MGFIGTKDLLAFTCGSLPRSRAQGQYCCWAMWNHALNIGGKSNFKYVLSEAAHSRQQWKITANVNESSRRTFQRKWKWKCCLERAQAPSNAIVVALCKASMPRAPQLKSKLDKMGMPSRITLELLSIAEARLGRDKGCYLTTVSVTAVNVTKAAWYPQQKQYVGN